MARQAKADPLLAAPDGKVHWTKGMQEWLDLFVEDPGLFLPGAGFEEHHAAHKALLGKDNWVPSAFRLLQVYGVDALPLFVDWIASKRYSPPAVQTALLNIHSEQAVDAVVERHRSAEFRPLVLKLAKKWPVFVLRKLLDVNPARKQPAALLIQEILNQDPGCLPLLREHASEAQSNTLVRLLEVADAAEEAEPAEFPPVLRELPWANREPSRVPSLSLQAIHDVPGIDWSRWKGYETLKVDGPDLSDLAYSEAVLKRSEIASDMPAHASSWDLARKSLWAMGLDAGAIERAIASESVHEDDFAVRSGRYWDCVSFLRFLPPNLALSVFNNIPAEGLRRGYRMPDKFAWFGAASLPRFMHLYPTASIQSMLLAACFDWDALAMYVARGFYANRWVKQEAGDWLLAYPAAAARGLLPAAFGEDPAERFIAQNAVRHLAANGQVAAVAEQAARYGSAAEEALRIMLSEPQRELLPEKLPAPPKSVHVPGLPRLYLKSNGKALPIGSVPDVLTIMALCKQDAPFSGLLALQEALTPESLAKFGQALFEWWRDNDTPPKERWIFWMQGVIGNDETARQLNVALKQWRAALVRVRAYDAMEMLVQIGSDVALMYLHQLSEQTRYNDLRERAVGMMEDLAEQRGLSMEQLADRTVPDLGLDQNGRLALDFGPRSFIVRFDEHLLPYVCDSDGKRIKDLPKPNSKDDEAIAKAASQRYKDLKKQAKNVARAQVNRLEDAMCGQRRWSAEEFETLLVRHPLLRHLVLRLVWGSYDASGKLLTLFRVAEDLSYADASDNALQLPLDAKLGIPHRLELADADAQAFAQLFADYEVLQPFEQLGRATYRLDEAALDGSTLPEWQDRRVSTGALLGLENRGWQREVGDGGCIDSFVKTLDGGKTVFITLEGEWFVGDRADPTAIHTITRCGLGGAQWRTLPPVLVSEIQRDLHQMYWTK
ncbi:DUF4132 domain-containing protein [Duganella sp. Root198D2]|uniref:DUF4132 domain-containing protein n=1 Tax=Duganella sp. Root198D2 TaxID=1736489 RepID=UPI000AB7B253|nr:DUF4132 domain-containing protein [Duganella sp. Root198D2]